MKGKSICLPLLTILCSLAWTEASPQSDSLTVARTRVVRWVANIDTANEIIEEKNDKLEAAIGAIKYLQNELTKDSTAIEDLRLYNANLFDETQEQKKEIAKKDAKIKRLRPWANAAKIGAVVGVAVVGIITYKELAP